MPADLLLSVWPTAQKNARSQRAGRYVEISGHHPAKMPPAIAAREIATYSKPGDLVCDPMAGIGSTLVEAVHLGRDAIGVEYEPNWAHLARANIAYARRQGETGHGVDRDQVGRLMRMPPIGCEAAWAYHHDQEDVA